MTKTTYTVEKTQNGKYVLKTTINKNTYLYAYDTFEEVTKHIKGGLQ